MNFFRQYRYVLLAMVALVAGCVILIQKMTAQPSRHVELREAFILLHTRGYTNQANRLYTLLLRELDRVDNKQLIDDFQRTLPLVDPAANQPENLVWKYHWTVSNELERRSESTLQRALKMAEEEK